MISVFLIINKSRIDNVLTKFVLQVSILKISMIKPRTFGLSSVT